MRAEALPSLEGTVVTWPATASIWERGPTIIPPPNFSGEATHLKTLAATSSVSETRCWAEEAVRAGSGHGCPGSNL